MINCDGFIDTVRQKLKTTAYGKSLEIRTYKGDRRIIITKNWDDDYSVQEDGFVLAHYDHLTIDELRKLLKTLQKREFPRSNKLRIRLIEQSEHRH